MAFPYRVDAPWGYTQSDKKLWGRGQLHDEPRAHTHTQPRADNMAEQVRFLSTSIKWNIVTIRGCARTNQILDAKGIALPPMHSELDLGAMGNSRGLPKIPGQNQAQCSNFVFFLPADQAGTHNSISTGICFWMTPFSGCKLVGAFPTTMVRVFNDMCPSAQLWHVRGMAANGLGGSFYFLVFFRNLLWGTPS